MYLSEDSTAIEGIESLVLSFLNQLVDASGPYLDEKLLAHERRAKSKIQIELASRRNNKSTKTLTYPRKCTSGSARPMAQLLRVMDLAHEAILEELPITKRDMYYNDVQLFKTQRTVDMLVDDLAATFDLDRSSLNIRASSKGLICGSGLTIRLVSGEILQPTNTEGTLIPVSEDIESFELDEDVAWVLIVEKEAVFQTLCRLVISDQEDLPGRGLLITGKGYPDIATRHLVKTLADYLPSRIPIMALVDADPYGLDILSVYNYGSNAMKHENEHLAAGGRVQWIGVWASEFSRLGIDKDKLLQITKGDEKKAFAMLKRPKDVLPSKWKKELQHMLFNRRKAEIEILSSTTTFDNDDDNPPPDPTAYPPSPKSMATFKQGAGLNNREQSGSAIDTEQLRSDNTAFAAGSDSTTTKANKIVLSSSSSLYPTPRGGTRNRLLTYLCEKINGAMEEHRPQ